MGLVSDERLLAASQIALFLPYPRVVERELSDVSYKDNKTGESSEGEMGATVIEQLKKPHKKQ